MELRHIVMAIAWIVVIVLCILLLTTGVSCDFLKEIYKYLTA